MLLPLGCLAAAPACNGRPGAAADDVRACMCVAAGAVDPRVAGTAVGRQVHDSARVLERQPCECNAC